jgi:hypothetical protein
MFDSDRVLSDLNTARSREAFEVAARLYWRIEHLAHEKALVVIRRLLPTVVMLVPDTEAEYDDAGGTYLCHNGVTLHLQDGTTFDLPDEGHLDDGTFEEGNSGPSISADTLARIDEACDADESLDRVDLLLAEAGKPFGLTAEQMIQLIGATSFAARSANGADSTFPRLDDASSTASNEVAP